MDLLGLSAGGYAKMYCWGRVKTLQSFPKSGLLHGEQGFIVGYRVDPATLVENLVCSFPLVANELVWSKREDPSVVWLTLLSVHDRKRTLGFRTEPNDSLQLPTDKVPLTVGQLVLPSIDEPKNTKKVIPDWPTTCRKCGSPAILLFTSFECSSSGCVN